MSPRILLPVFVLSLLLAPQLVSEFHVTLLNYIGLYSIVAIGLVLLTGVGGLMSFGQAAFVGLGGYATAYLTTTTSLPVWIAFLGGSPWLGLLAGVVLTAAVALLLGLLTLRLSGHYLPLGTIAWSISLYFLFGNLEFLGGHTGISGIPALSMFGLPMKDARNFYYLIWVVVLLAAWLTINLLDSREGRAIRALKGGVVMAEAGVGFVVADEAFRLRVELKIDVQILGDGAEVQDLREQAGDAERGLGLAFAHARVDEAIEVIALQRMQPHRVFVLHHLRARIQERMTVVRAALHEVVALFAVEE